jgi:nicotinamide riboside transporter PnuC
MNRFTDVLYFKWEQQEQKKKKKKKEKKKKKKKKKKLAINCNAVNEPAKSLLY